MKLEDTFYGKVEKTETSFYDVEVIANSTIEAREKILSSMDLLIRNNEWATLTHKDVNYSFLGFRTEHIEPPVGKSNFPLGGTMLSENYVMDEEGDVWIRLPEGKSKV